MTWQKANKWDSASIKCYQMWAQWLKLWLNLMNVFWLEKVNSSQISLFHYSFNHILLNLFSVISNYWIEIRTGELDRKWFETVNDCRNDWFDWDKFNHKLFILPQSIDKSLFFTFCVSVEVRLGSESLLTDNLSI